MKYLLTLFVYFIFFVSCNNNEKTDDILLSSKEENIEFYKDFDLFHFQGLGKVSKNSSLTYPYLSIEDTAKDSLRISIYPSPQINMHWECYSMDENKICKYVYQDNDDGLFHKIFMIFENNEMLEIEYVHIKDEKKDYLVRVTKKNKHVSESYTFSRFAKLRIPMKMNLQEFPLEKGKYKEQTQYYEEEEILKVVTSLKDLANDKIIDQDETCYQLNGSSVFWWNLIGYTFRSFKCSLDDQY